MCLAIPSKIVAIENNIGTVEVEGVQRKASLLLVENPKIGEYVILHAGFAIQKVDEKAAEESLAAMREIMDRLDNDR